MSLFTDMILQNIQSNYKLLCIEKLLVGLISKFDKDAIFKSLYKNKLFVCALPENNWDMRFFLKEVG